jgi:pre-rRNA-processing protein TSR1
VDKSIEAAWIPESDSEDEEADSDADSGEDAAMHDEPSTDGKTVRFDRAVFDDEPMADDDQSDGEEYEDADPQMTTKHKRDEEEFDLDFPDEMDVPMGENARERFQKCVVLTRVN